MSVIEITSLEQFRQLCGAFKGIVVADFYTSSATQFAPIFEKVASVASTEEFIFVKVNAEQHQDIAEAFQVAAPPTFVLIRDSKVIRTASGTDIAGLRGILSVLRTQAAAGESSGSGSGSGSGSSATPAWLGAGLPRGYKDITSQIEHRRVDLLNFDSEKGGVRVLFSPKKPSALSGGESKEVDWLESDTDEQLLLFMPFQSVLKLHTLQITSIPPSGDDLEEDEIPMRPKTIKLFHNRPNNLGFDQAESTSATQEIEISESDWNAEGTANIPLRFVKFQNINSLVIFVVDGDGASLSQKVRLDRLRLIGDSGEKREMGKLEKIGDEQGE